MGHALDTEHPVHKAMVFMAEKLREKSEGKVTLEIYPGGQLGQESELIEQVQLGLLDITKVSTSPLESFIPIYSVFSVPYLFRDNTHFWNVLDSPIGKQLLKAGESVSLKGLCYYDAGSRSFYTKEKPIMSPDDLTGMKIRVMNSKTAMQMMKELGASSVAISWGELYTSLQQGVVDGAENNPPSFYRSGHYEVCKHYSLDEHTMVPDIVIIGTITWNKLSSEVRQMVQEAADESVVYQKQLWKEDSDEALRIVQEQGVTVYHPDKTPFREKIKQMHASYDGTEVGELMKQISDVQ
jgi:tripartite ATP-independent transporter DctP family solute receptor